MADAVAALDHAPDKAPRAAIPKWLRTALWFIGVIAFLALCYEGYKFVWVLTDGTIFGWEWPARGNDTAMPHTWSIVERLFDPAQRGQSEILLVDLLKASLFTLRLALIGFVIGAVFGFGLGVLFVRFPLAERRAGFIAAIISRPVLTSFWREDPSWVAATRPGS